MGSASKDRRGSITSRERRVVYVVAAAAILAAHVLVVTIGVAKAAPWLGGITATLLVVCVTVLHVAGLRRLARRRRTFSPTAGTDPGRDNAITKPRWYSHDRARPPAAAHDHAHGRGADDAVHGHPGGVRGVVLPVFRPHSHDPGDRVDPAIEASAEGMRAVRNSFAILGATAGMQFALVVVTGSVALLADMTHNLADALTAIPIGVAFLVGRRPANRRFTYGYGRGEDIAGLLVLLAVAASSLLAGRQAVERLLHPRPLSGIVLVVAAGLVGFVGNEAVALYRIRIGRRIGSAALVADGLHARTDGLTSLAVLVGAIGVAAGWPAADAIAGLVISIAIVGVLIQAAREVFGRMMDRVDETTVTTTSRVVAAVPGVAGVDRVRMRWVGHELLAEVDVSASAALSLPEAHDIAEAVRHELLHEVHRLGDANIHVSPVADGGTDPHGATRHHFVRAGAP